MLRFVRICFVKENTLKTLKWLRFQSAHSLLLLLLLLLSLGAPTTFNLSWYHLKRMYNVHISSMYLVCLILCLFDHFPIEFGRQIFIVVRLTTYEETNPNPSIESSSSQLNIYLCENIKYGIYGQSYRLTHSLSHAYFCSHLTIFSRK